MPSVQQLLSRAGALLRAHPLLWTPPLAIALLMALANPGGPNVSGPMFLVVSLINLAVTLGWLELIDTADRGEKPTWDAFFTAIGRHFQPMVLGSLAALLVVLAVALPLVLLAVVWADPAVLTALGKELPALTKQLQANPDALASLQPAYLVAMSRLLVGVMAGAIWYGLVSLALLYWNQALVLGKLGWREAWKDSWAMFRGHLGLTLGLVTWQTLGFVLGFALGAAPLPLDLIGWMLVFACQVVFPVAFTLAYRQAHPPVPEPVT